MIITFKQIRDPNEFTRKSFPLEAGPFPTIAGEDDCPFPLDPINGLIAIGCLEGQDWIYTLDIISTCPEGIGAEGEFFSANGACADSRSFQVEEIFPNLLLFCPDPRRPNDLVISDYTVSFGISTPFVVNNGACPTCPSDYYVQYGNQILFDQVGFDFKDICDEDETFDLGGSLGMMFSSRVICL